MNDHIYIVLDTNVLVSGMFIREDRIDTPPRKIVKMFLAGELTIFYSDAILAEYKEVLTRKKFNFSKHRIKKMLELAELLGVKIDPRGPKLKLQDTKDEPFLELANATNTLPAFLVTGNKKHFPNKKHILTPAELCKELC